MLTLAELAEAFHETIELCGQRIRTMLQGERVELPLEVLVLIQEIEDSSSGFPLDASPADWTDSKLAAFRTQEELTRLHVLAHPGVLPALAESRDLHDVRLDLVKAVEPELTLLLTPLEPQDLLGSVRVDGELAKTCGPEL